MGTLIVRYNGLYYVQPAPQDEECESSRGNYGHAVVDSIPAQPDQYQKWLTRMREAYASMEGRFELEVFALRARPFRSTVDWDKRPSMMPCIREPNFGRDYYYIIDLDREIFSVDFGAHYKLGNIPRGDHLWRRALADSIFHGCTVDTRLCHEDQLASPALPLPLPKPVTAIPYACRAVAATTDLGTFHKQWRIRLLTATIYAYRKILVRFGREWQPQSLPFREIAFALLWIAAGKSEVLSLEECGWDYKDFEANNWSDGIIGNAMHGPHGEKRFPEDEWNGHCWIGGVGPLLQFGSLFHTAYEAPGVSPAETIYWIDEVLVSLVLVADGAAVAEAVAWGLADGWPNFQLVVMSLFDVVLVEVSTLPGEEPVVKVSDRLPLSPLRPEECLSTHPSERPVFKEGMKRPPSGYEEVSSGKSFNTRSKSYPGLAALINFFDAATNRRTAVRTTGVFPPEIYHSIIDHLEYYPWQRCSAVSPAFRSYCGDRFRVDDDWYIMANSASGLHDGEDLSFDMKNMRTGRIEHVREVALGWGGTGFELFSWMPIIGNGPWALMTEVLLEFW
ncbi:8bb7b5de-d412-4a38-bd2c-279fa3d1e022 [Thermothielavioides terrestris]|uniref:8bb7b5de-d412-4a38-bd2c-279fa3d1e022 n=1 Tax=Thermothielavioides terrestris TaxID=2587410 RepID=A0A3S4AQE4_9PEZI|nr:8bb7b5de-d412-4a38-bd2c-279fa3d1e022 [Thermothielavioides terrestris]